MIKDEQKILHELSRGQNLTIHTLLERTGMGPHKLSVTLYGLSQVAWIGRAGNNVWITPAGREAYVEVQHKRAARWDRMICPGCGTLRFGPRHLALRLARWCDGKGSLV